MEKQALLQLIYDTWQQMHLEVVSGNGADLTLSADLLGASWSTGKKNIHYEVSLLVDEARRTVFFYEESLETSQGFSFGFRSSRTWQVGRTVFRKVKAVQYGPEGHVYAYEFDLGAIPKSARQIARQNGWAYKTVLNRSHASY